jgi:hypothetical protein
MAQAHGGRLVSKALARHGTTHLFTLCGGHIQAIYDGCLDDGIRVVDVRHEQTAGHAADGYARVTGRPGVCAVTAAPASPTWSPPSPTRPARRHPDDRHRRRRSARSAGHGLAPGHEPRRADAPHHQVERRGALHRSHPGVHRLRVPHRAGQRPRPGVPRDAARSAHELGRRRRARHGPVWHRPAPAAIRAHRRGRRAAAQTRAAHVHRGQPAPLVPVPRRDPRFADGRGALLPQRHGPRRPPVRAPEPHEPLAQVRPLPDRSLLRLRHALRLPPRVRPRHQPQAPRSCRSISTAPRSARNRRVDLAIDGDSGLVLDQLCRRGRRQKSARLARHDPRQRGQEPREDGRRDRANATRRTRCACAPSSASA